MDPQIFNCPTKWLHLYHFEVYESSKKPIVGVLVEPISQNGYKDPTPTSIQIQMSPHELKNAKFNNLDLDNQMSGTCGQYEPLKCIF